MPDNEEQVVIETPTDVFSTESWKAEPTVATPVVEAIEEKVEVVEEKPKDEKPTDEKPTEEVKPTVAAPEPIKFENEESEKVFNHLKEGKIDDVLPILVERDKLLKADKLSPAEALKLSLQYQNKDFTPQEVQDLFDETYVYPEKPVREDLEDDDEFKAREEKYNKSVEKIENKIARDAKPAITELQKLAKEIKIPDTLKNISEEKPPTQEELDAAKQNRDRFFTDLSEASKDFKGYTTNFKDEEVEIKAVYTVSPEEEKALAPLLESAYSDLPALFEQLKWVDKEGKVTGKLKEDLHLLQNKESVLNKLVSEAATQRYAEAKKLIKNIDYSGNGSSAGNAGKTPEQAKAEMSSTFFEI